MKHEWKDVLGNEGVLLTSEAERLLMSLKNESSKVLHVLDIPTARALHEALGRAIAEVDSTPAPSRYEGDDDNPECSQDDYEAMTYITDSISATLAACSDSVPDILRKIDAACGESQSAAVVTGPDGMRVHRSLRSISTAELAKLGLKPKAHLPSDGYLLECGHWSIHKQWCTECAADIVAISQRASQPEPPPTGNGDLVTPSLLDALADYPELAALVKDRNAFRRTHNGRDPLEDARQELGDLLQYLWQAKMEGRDIHPFLDLWSSAYTALLPSDEQYERVRRNMLEYVEAVRDVTTGSKPESRARAHELYAAIKQDMLDGDPRMSTVDRLREMMGPAPTLHPRPFWWDFNDGRFVAVDGNHNYLGIETVNDLLECAPNALDGLESKYPQEAHELPSFGFRREHTGPRTLREYLEAPDAGKTA